MSKNIARRQVPYIVEDLSKKMVLVAGPRQCGKTTLARELLRKTRGHYYNWDSAADRAILRRGELEEAKELWVFDELHKHRQWRNWLKGVFDTHRDRHRILVTGSARLDIYSRGGDSLQGRYYKHRMHPLTFSEVAKLPAAASPTEVVSSVVEGTSPPKSSKELLKDLLALSGFPEPFLAGSARDAERFRRSYGELLVREDIRTLETIRDLDRMELLFERLPIGVGSVLSINALREDLEVAFETVRHWISVLENTYAVFRIPPFGPPRIKAVKKEQKLYCWDWSRVDGAGPRFENLIALHLLRYVHWAEDVFGEKFELRYFRDVAGHEVDFVVLRKGAPFFAVECKSQLRPLDPNLKYLLLRSKIPYAFQVHLEGDAHVRHPDIGKTEVHQLSAAAFLAALP